VTKFVSAAATSHTLSLAAMEEASRSGERTTDVGHLLMALAVNEQVAGQVLRGLGVTLDVVREAVAAQHAEQLASLGIEAEAPAGGKIVFHETGGYEWDKPSLKIFERASDGDKRGDAAAVLRELVAEPSGMVAAVLRRLGTTPEAVVEGLDEAERYPSHTPLRTVEPGRLSGVSEAFVPAPVERVWELLADASRMPEWEPGIGSVESGPSTVRVGDTWVARARTTRPDGKVLKVKPELVAQRVEVVALEEGHLLEWCFTFPGVALANARRIRVELEPAAGGTQLRLALAWDRNADRPRRPVRALLLRPLTRFSIWMQLSQLGGGISRVFR
jgi:uncharacterized protein YndB with AHSA1/START domain